MVIAHISKDDVAINAGKDAFGNDIWLSERNSHIGRQHIIERCLPDIVDEVMNVWGDVFVSDPPSMPAQKPVLPTPQEDSDALLIDHEYRLTLLELGVS